MIRLFIVILISFCSVVPFLALFHRFLELDDDIAGYLSFFFAWLVTPYILLKLWKEKPGIEVLPVDTGDPLMQEQIKIAKEQFHRFIEGLSEGRLEAFVKFPYEFEGDIEHVWGLAHSIKGDDVIVSLASDPVGSPPEEVYERLNISIKNVEDWMLLDSKGRTKGGYTMLAMARIYEREYGKLPKRYVKDLGFFDDFTWKSSV